MDNETIRTPRGPLTAVQVEVLDAQARGETPAAGAALLRQALRWIIEHGQHPPACAALRGRACDCGLDALRAGRVPR